MKQFLKTWALRDDASAAIEAGFLFPLMVTILVGVIDVGNAVVVNQKVISASHTMVDLLTRETTVSQAMIDDAQSAAQMALEPYDTASLGHDIQSIKVNAASNPQWNDTENMEMNSEVMSILTSAGYVGATDEGVIAITVQFTYTPIFMNYLTGSFPIQELSYARARGGAYIPKV